MKVVYVCNHYTEARWALLKYSEPKTSTGKLSALLCFVDNFNVASFSTEIDCKGFLYEF